MKNIRITSFQNESNYGALLQAFALQSFSSILGNETSHINYVSKFYYASPYLKSERKVPLYFVRIYRWIKSFILNLFIPSNRKFINRSFTKLKKTSFSESRNNADILITGSDQVWNHNFIWGREKIYFLGFGKPSAKRISYAASLGVSSWPKSFEKKVLPLLKRFNAISVREESSVTYLNSLGLEKVTCVCDPTILHNGNFYRETFGIKKESTEKKPFVYRIRVAVPKAVSNILPSNMIEVVLRDPNNKTLVPEWLSYIDNAKFVVTDSFHCAVFCILFHKPFLVIPNQSTGKGMNERFATLLGKTSLEYRCLTCEETTEQVLEKLNSPIDWDHVDAVLEEWRTYSANWLKNALEG